MDLTSEETIKKLLLNYETAPIKRLGQNFLIDKDVVEKVVEVADLTKQDIILEIGPGIGVLTKPLALKTQFVIAIEKDSKIIKILKETTKNCQNIQIINQDAREIFNNTQLKIPENYKLVANLPFYITAPTIRMFLEAKNYPKEMILITQKEVAERICALPPKMNILAVATQFYAKPKIISFIERSSFWPQPKVDSAILQIKPTYENKSIDSKLFFRIVKAGFLQPRKQLLNNFSGNLNISREKAKNWLADCNIEPTQRAQTLSMQNWILLTRTFNDKNDIIT